MDAQQAEELLDLISQYIREQDRAEFARAYPVADRTGEREQIVAKVADLLG